MTTALHTPQEAARWLRTRVTGALHADSRRIGAGDGFIAWPGAATDGRRFVNQALVQGAAACMIEAEGADAFGFESPAVAQYAGLKAATGPIAAAYYESPSRQMEVIAITGTNGKTSTAWWLAYVLSNLQHGLHIPCGLVGTLGVGVPPNVRPTGMTTPDPVLLQAQFRAFADADVRACAIEASSIGIAERRLDGTHIAVAVFTNFTQDHLDYHGSMQAYWQSKAELFDWPGLKAAVINLDDPRGPELQQRAEARGLAVWTVSMHQPARLRAEGLRYDETGLVFDLREGAHVHSVRAPLVGDYNVSNLLGVLAACRALHVPLAEAIAACASLPSVPGRMEQVSQPGAPLAVIDYAHTPDALEKALQALRPLARQRGGQMVCVFGCGGNRDAGKRPLMAAAAEQGADRVVLTSDNPRGEDPRRIADDVLAGFAQPDAVYVELDRAAAIAHAVRHAAPSDVVLIAGKGHEDYQEIGETRLPFSDRIQARQALQARGQAAGGRA